MAGSYHVTPGEYLRKECQTPKHKSKIGRRMLEEAILKVKIDLALVSNSTDRNKGVGR